MEDVGVHQFYNHCPTSGPEASLLTLRARRGVGDSSKQMVPTAHAQRWDRKNVNCREKAGSGKFEMSAGGTRLYKNMILGFKSPSSLSMSLFFGS